MRLIADIGGTNARFALVDGKGEIFQIRNFLKNDYESVADAINDYKVFTGEDVSEILLAVNTPIVDGRPHINANNWGYENKNLEKDVGVKKIIFFNDLQAHAMSLPFLKKSEKTLIHGKNADTEGTVAIIGSGTGLGLAYGIYDAKQKKHNFYPSEGGNQVASPVDDEQVKVIGKLLKILPFVRWEDISSGRGINSLYNALFGQDKSTEIIMQEFAEGSEKSRKVFTLFCEFLGAFTHNVGDTFLPSGGIYITGGILTRKENVEFMTNNTRFLDYYSSQNIYKDRSKYLEQYPIYLITHPNPALLGLAGYERSR